MSPVYRGWASDFAISAVERFDLETWLRSASIPADRRELMLAIMAQEQHLAGDAEEADDRIESAEFNKREAEEALGDLQQSAAATDLELKQVYGHYGDLVAELRKALAATSLPSGYEPLIRDHEAVIAMHAPDPSPAKE